MISKNFIQCGVNLSEHQGVVQTEEEINDEEKEDNLQNRFIKQLKQQQIKGSNSDSSLISDSDEGQGIQLEINVKSQYKKYQRF
ncbi:hypothetical protein TTHERM_00328500 (macronuclear) [Tetrahymena thermophila SB210]|uniref:Uncharacterized protein n=1 Tax=Tetrahymena thermophila (strain SB210) TaxID=312017 RepID=I7MJH1_TETTS|nr:hypothetical protein TTHERM_00328500 [Tetrahymena thermophila SB210]EAS06269.2 hypothetical protein TTHERM_00328500 [Tetrahymena thermophila SB210]|eukprot:XP_001026514.2 hypothetical protein TTHERM_00328500 [Tetrahymena thermophila SB210]